MERFLRLWCTRSVVRRGLLTAIPVGTLLAFLNHGEAILSGHLSSQQLVKIALTPLIPYLVSTSSVVFATLERMDEGLEGRANRPSP